MVFSKQPETDDDLSNIIHKRTQWSAEAKSETAFA